jgi:P27 family predicted phage terminase small subunit
VSRPRKPTALKVVGGTERADRRNANEPEPPLLNDLTPPAHLAERSAAVWRQVAPIVRQMQVLTVADIFALELLCDSIADYRHARSQVGDDFVTYSSKGSQMVDQWLVAQQMSRKAAEGLISKFGLDPRARASIMVNPQPDLFDRASPERYFSN